MNRVIFFIKNGFCIFSDSSKGNYHERTDEIEALRREILSKNFGSFKTDKENLIKDRKSISHDVRMVFYNLINQ